MAKKKYKVKHIQIQDYGDGRVDELVLGEYSTWAASDKGAINNIRYRLGLNSRNIFSEWNYDGSRRDILEAMPFKEGKHHETERIV